MEKDYRKHRGRPGDKPDTVAREDLKVAISLMTQRRRDEILSRIITKRTA